MADDALIEHILRAVEAVPPGRVATYGDIASIVGIGPRHVGNVLSRWGHSAPWWRITNSKGELPTPLLEQAHPRWREEGTPTKPSGGCHLDECRADLAVLEREWERSVADVPR